MWLDYGATLLNPQRSLFRFHPFGIPGNSGNSGNSGDTILISTMPASVTLAYDNLGNRTSLTRGNGTVTSYAYDPAARLTSFTHDLSGAAQDVTSSFTYNPASQIATRTRSNDAFAWSQAVAVNRAYVNNGLNQHTQSGAIALGYDGRGNLTGSGATTYVYSAENRLASVVDSGGSRLFSYDALGRLALTNGAALTYFEYEFRGHNTN